MKNNFLHLINRIPLWLELSFLMFIITTITIFTLIYRNFTSIRSLTIEHQVSLSTRLLNLEMDNLDRYISDLAYFAIQPYYDAAFTRIINQKAPLTSSQIDYAKQQMHYYYYTRNDIQEYEIYFLNQNMSIGRTSTQEHMTSYYSPSFDVEKASLSCALDSNYQSIISSPESDFFTYYHSLFQVKGKKQQAIVRLQVNKSYFNQIMNNHTEKGSLLVILNGNNEFVFSNNTSVFSDGENDISEILNTKSVLNSEAKTVLINENNYLSITVKSEKTGMQLINFIPISNIDSELNKVGSVTFVNGFLIWLITVFVIYLFVYLLTRPLKSLSERMKQAGSGDFQTFPDMQGSSEITELSSSFNFMLTHIDQLIQKNYVAELSEKNAKLTALEAQLNPHFLYNTLQAISTEALINDQLKIHQMITTLASNLRYTIKSGDLVPLKDELQYLTDYIYLQKMRMGDSLYFEIMSDKSLGNYLVPKISLQALVENSIIHGKSSEKETIKIHVKIEMFANNKLQISVLDDGCGISEEQLQKLYHGFHEAMTAKNPGGIGLANLYVRLHLLYNAPTDLQIYSKENKYTNIILTLPCTYITAEE